MSERGTSGSGSELPPTLASLGGSGDGPADGDLVGRVLGGRYRILRKLGEGAMGAVYLGEHLKIGRQDAIKVLRDSLATDPDTIARFVRGTRNVSMIRHPNICTIYDYSDIAGGIQFVAMEFVPGETLRDLLQRQGRLPLDVAVHIARQAAEALDAAHEVGIVHRDLKPANIMVVQGKGGRLDVKVVDFDIAKGSADGEGEEVTRMGFVVGTPEYMSPEQLIGDRLDGRSDIYSLALVLYRMLTGTLPFASEDTQDLMVKRLTEEPLSLAAGLPGAPFPPALEAAIRRALQRKPAERQATAGEFGREISAAIEQPGTVGPTAAHAPPATPGRQPAGAAASGRRKIPLAAMLGGAGAVAVGLLLTGVLVFGGDDQQEPGASPPPEIANPAAGAVEFDDPLATVDPEGVQGGAAGDSLGGNPSSVTGANEIRTSLAAGADDTRQGGTAVPSPTLRPPPTDDEFFALMDRLDPASSRATLLAVRDTAVTAWQHPQASAYSRAFAAYVAGQAFYSLGDVAQAVQWIERADALRPGYQPYTSLLQTYRQLLSGY
ncbi:MAG TPA: protein kinase [Longimicrobiaceae bacterium]